MAFSKNRTVHFAMDTTTGNLNKDLAIMDNIESKLEAAGIKVERHSSSNVTKGRGPGAMYNNMAYLAENNIHDAIMLHLMNGVDPSNIREVSYMGKGGNDNRGDKARKNGNDVILAWFWDACDCVHEGGNCYKSVRGSETGSRLYNPKQMMDNNDIKAICVSSKNPNLSKGDYNGDLVAEEVIKLFENTTTTTETTTTDTTITNSEGKTLKSETVEKIYTKAYYSELFTVKTDENGTFQVPVKLPYAGDYIVNSNFAGDKDYSPSTRTTHIDNQSGEIFERELLMTRTTRDYGTNEAEVTEEGSTAGHDHTVSEKIVTTYGTDGTVSTTTTTTADGDATIYSPYDEKQSPTTTANVETVSTTKKDPFKEVVGASSDGKPQVTKLQTGDATYEFVDLTKTYTLSREQYTAVFKRDSQTMQLQNYKMSKYVAFQCEEYPNKYFVVERERWNMFEESYYAWMVYGGNDVNAGKKNWYVVVPYPQKLKIDFPKQQTVFVNEGGTRKWKAEKGNIYYCGDNQNYGRTCGPTASSVTTQVLHNYYSERNMNQYINATGNGGSGQSDIRDALQHYGFYASLFGSGDLDKMFKWIKDGKPVVFHKYDHYVALCDMASDGSVLLLNSVNDDGTYGPPTGWYTQQYIRNKYYRQGVLVGLNWSISDDEKQRLNNFYQNMGGEWKKQENKNEKVTFDQMKYLEIVKKKN